MLQIHYRRPDGETTTLEATEGQSVMQVARQADLPGIVAICGGNMMCGTCHVAVDAAWIEKAGPPNPDEAGVLDALDSRANVSSASRLACQIEMTSALDGLIVHLPRYQPGV